MKRIGFGCLLLWLTAACFGQAHESLCPRHIEAPVYPQLAHTAHVTGKVVLSVAIGADGNVTDAEVTNRDKRGALLENSATENIRHWTFAMPPSAPYVQRIVYDYEIDGSLPGDGGDAGTITRVNFDLPDRVTILTNAVTIR